MTAASGAALSLALLPQRAAGQSPPTSAASDQFETAEIKTDDNTIFIRRYGSGSPLLMVHGFPRTSLMWRHVAPHLAGKHTVICVDLHSYGRSGIPASAEDHYPYSKGAMAKELVAVMDKLGFPNSIWSDTIAAVGFPIASRSIIWRRCGASRYSTSCRSRKPGTTPTQNSP